MFKFFAIVPITLNGLLSLLNLALEDPQFSPISNPKKLSFNPKIPKHLVSTQIEP